MPAARIAAAIFAVSLSANFFRYSGDRVPAAATLATMSLKRSCTHGVSSVVASAALSLRDDRLGRALGEIQAKPGVDFEVGKALFGGAPQVRHFGRAFALQDGDALDRIAVDQLLAGRASVQM